MRLSFQNFRILSRNRVKLAIIRIIFPWQGCEVLVLAARMPTCLLLKAGVSARFLLLKHSFDYLSIVCALNTFIGRFNDHRTVLFG